MTTDNIVQTSLQQLGTKLRIKKSLRNGGDYKVLITVKAMRRRKRKKECQ